ncbi:uncharacterized protein LOC129960286 [Argiope bruennichi]|uniref:uncharacterized protein LOC129960286 n=1 Tax=Argiope bruennichi TaxID=94029 RepID=UPI0024941BF2|nr:uncharacterized protein LOC129960286 [Argiope bruennichi]
MHLNFVALCVTVGVVSVFGGCVKDRFLFHEHFPAKEAHLKDVELIDGELKLKLDRKIEEKELLEKTLAALKSYFMHEHETLEKGKIHSLEEFHVPTEEKHEITCKILKGLFGSDFKTEELTEKDLAAFEGILKYFFEHSKGEEAIDKIFKSKVEDSSVKHSEDVEKIAKMSEFAPEEGKDVKTYIAESILHAGISKDADVHHGIEEGEALFKKLEKTGGEIPYFLMDDEAKKYLKGITEGKISEAEIHTLVGGDEEALKKLFKILKDGASHEEGSFLYSSEHIKGVDLEKSAEAAKALEEHKTLQKELISNHGKDHVFDEILKKEEVHELDEGFEEKKFFGTSKALAEHKETALNHAKDHIYDDILKKEEIHSLDKGFEEEKFHGAAKSFEEHLIGKDIHASGEKAFGIDEAVAESKSKEFIAKSEESAFKKLSKEEEKAKAGKDLSIEEILKEDGYYITGGTHAYEAARDQAHEDAKIPLVEGKEKAIDSSIAHGEEVFHKASEEGAEFSKGKEAVLHGIKGKEGILKEKVHGTDIALKEEHIKHGIKTEETHLIHEIPEEHHIATDHKIDETLTKEIPHSKMHQIKHKLLSMLGKILHIKKCHLVTMPPRELLGIVDCISRSKNPLLCEKFAMCEKKMPLQVILALEKCQKETIPGEVKRCSKYEPLYPSLEIPYKIFKCIVKNTHELTPPEKKMMIDFEECARQVKVESCGRIPWG